MLLNNKNRLEWRKEGTGEILPEGTAPANGSTYYAEIPKGRATGFSVTLNHDGVAVETYSLEATDATGDDATAFATTWWDTRPAIGSKSAAAGVGVKSFEVSGAETGRYRVKRAVTIGGSVPGRWSVAGN